MTQYIGEIKYVNPKQPYYFHGNTYQLFFEKRTYFNFEEEVRILTEYKYENTDQLMKLPIGIKIQIDPIKLIQKIFLAPLADLSFKKLVELKLRDLDLNIDVSFSYI